MQEGIILRFTEKPEKFSLRVKLTNSRKKDLITLYQALIRSSEKEHKADALALGAEEGRDKLR